MTANQADKILTTGFAAKNLTCITLTSNVCNLAGGSYALEKHCVTSRVRNEQVSSEDTV